MSEPTLNQRMGVPASGLPLLAPLRLFLVRRFDDHGHIEEIPVSAHMMQFLDDGIVSFILLSIVRGETKDEVTGTICRAFRVWLDVEEVVVSGLVH